MKTNLSDSLFSLTAKANYHYYEISKWYKSVNWLKAIAWAITGTIALYLFLSLLLAGGKALAQTKPGFHAIGIIGTTNVSRDQRILLTASPELMYMGKTFGIGAVYNSTLNLYKDSKTPHHNPKGQSSSFGLKLHAKLFKVDQISVFATAEADKYIAKIDKKINGEYEFRPGAAIALPIRKRLDARFGYNPYIYKQNNEWQHKHGASFGLALRL